MDLNHTSDQSVANLNIMDLEFAQYVNSTTPSRNNM